MMTGSTDFPFERRTLSELAEGLNFFRAVFGSDEFTAQNLSAIRANTVAAFDGALAALPKNDRVSIRDDLAPGLNGAPDVPVRIYRPKAAIGVLPCVFWIHGGGMIMGAVRFDDLDCQRYAEEVNCVVVSVEYRLAPEVIAPALTEDCYAGLSWVFTHADDLGIDAQRVAVAGRSGGGCLAAATALMARDRGGPTLAYQLLIYPMLDDRNRTSSAREFVDVPSWGGRQNQSAWQLILGGEAGGDGVSPYAAPARADDLSGLPPTMIQVGELEVFRDESIEYAQRLLRAGVPCELHVHPGLYHGSDMFNPMAQSSEVMAQERFGVLRAALHRKGSGVEE